MRAPHVPCWDAVVRQIVRPRKVRMSGGIIGNNNAVLAAERQKKR